MYDSTSYRADIDGLRAIAILLVVASHAGVPLLQSGFVGVDVFFVISGYLITALLCSEIQSTGTISLLTFYMRRLRRLLPALVAMVVLISCAASVLLAPFEQIDQSRNAVHALTWTSNIYFALNNFNYFDQGASISLFLHTWSLGVEEQFYLVWPLFLLMLVWTSKKFAFGTKYGSSTNIRLFALVTVLFALLSFFITILNPLHGFYMAYSRFWQFLSGALIFAVSKKLASASSTSAMPVPSVAGWIGLLVIIGSAVLLPMEIEYPGIWALIPTLATMLVLLCGSVSYSQRFSVSSVLSHGILVRLGKYSYSWYLWHWPLFVFLKKLWPSHDYRHVAVMAVVSLGLAIVSYHVIEHPLRYSRILVGNLRTTFAFALILTASSFLAANQWGTAATTWEQSADQLKFRDARSDLAEIYRHGCDEWYFNSNLKPCSIGNETAKKTVVLLGDSIGAQWFPAFHAVSEKENWNLIVLTKSACPMVDVPFYYARIGRVYTECSEWKDKAFSYIRELKPDIVVMGSARYDFDTQQWINGTRKVIEQFTGVTQIFILQPNPGLGIDGPACLARQSWQERRFSLTTQCQTTKVSKLNIRIESALLDVASGYGNVDVIDLNEHICPSTHCEAANESTIIYRDSQHLTASFVQSLAPQIRRTMLPLIHKHSLQNAGLNE